MRCGLIHLGGRGCRRWKRRPLVNKHGKSATWADFRAENGWANRLRDCFGDRTVRCGNQMGEEEMIARRPKTFRLLVSPPLSLGHHAVSLVVRWPVATVPAESQSPPPALLAINYQCTL